MTTVGVRLTVCEPTANGQASALLRADEWFRCCAQFYRAAAGIELVLLDGAPTLETSETLAQPPYRRYPIDALWLEGQRWITAVVVQSFGETVDGSDPYGSTFFSRRRVGYPGCGCVVMDGSRISWAVLAHELGHHLGLPHTFQTDNPVDDETGTREERIDLDGVPYTRACMTPFVDDTRQLSEEEDACNLMSGAWPSVPAEPYATDYFRLTPNQVRRAQLTAFSRVAPISYRAETGVDPRLDRYYPPHLPDLPAVALGGLLP